MAIQYNVMASSLFSAEALHCRTPTLYSSNGYCTRSIAMGQLGDLEAQPSSGAGGERGRRRGGGSGRSSAEQRAPSSFGLIAIGCILFLVIVAQRGWVGPPPRTAKSRRRGRFAAAKKAAAETESGRRSFDQYLRSFQLSESGDFAHYLHETLEDDEEEKKDESDATGEHGEDGNIDEAPAKMGGAGRRIARAKAKVRARAQMLERLVAKRDRKE